MKDINIYNIIIYIYMACTIKILNTMLVPMVWSSILLFIKTFETEFLGDYQPTEQMGVTVYLENSKFKSKTIYFLLDMSV